MSLLKIKCNISRNKGRAYLALAIGFWMRQADMCNERL
jgi:hypothetical protein